MNRKDDHIQFASMQNPQINDFDKMRFVHHAFPETNLDEIDLSIQIFNRKFPLPFFINAMTGGSDQAKMLNERFARLAKHYQIPIATGSVSAAIKNPAVASSFTVLRDIYPEGFVFANVGGGQTLVNAKKAIDLLKANALQIHINPVQEAVMPEGDKHFKGWLSLVQSIRQGVTIPVVVKEVGFGMSQQSFQQLQSIGIEYVDVAGQGGTNFSIIENHRRTHKIQSFDQWGISTVQSLLTARKFPKLTIFASGGIRQPLDVMKSLALGAKIVGLSGYFLQLVQHHTHEEAVGIIDAFIEELKLIMLVLGKKNIGSLTTAAYTLDPSLKESI
jgi:isopentenyl-diphosphate delta-isomerase